MYLLLVLAASNYESSTQRSQKLEECMRQFQDLVLKEINDLHKERKDLVKKLRDSRDENKKLNEKVDEYEFLLKGNFLL